LKNSLIDRLATRLVEVLVPVNRAVDQRDLFNLRGDNVVATVRSKSEDLAAKLDHHPKLHVAILDINEEAQAIKLAAETVERFSSIAWKLPTNERSSIRTIAFALPNSRILARQRSSANEAI
jgi:hypothetical protein